MFAHLYPEPNRNRFLMFVFSLWLQVTVLLALAMIGGQRFSHMPGPSIRHPDMTRAAVTPIYFRPNTPAAPSVPDTAAPATLPAPEAASKTQTETQDTSNTQADAGDEHSGQDDAQGLAPFPSWSMNSRPGSFTVFGHQITAALPIFTPDPPVLHGEVPDPARGKDMVLDVVIDNQGSIVQATILQGAGFGVESSVMETLRRWIFVPAKVNGMPVASRRQLRFHFPG